MRMPSERRTAIHNCITHGSHLPIAEAKEVWAELEAVEAELSRLQSAHAETPEDVARQVREKFDEWAPDLGETWEDIIARTGQNMRERDKQLEFLIADAIRRERGGVTQETASSSD